MPRIIVGNRGRRDISGLSSLKYNYTYPNKLDLTPGSKLHDSIVDSIIELAGVSHDVVSRQFSSWRNIDDILTAYVMLDENEKDIKHADSRKPTSVVFPYSYAIMDALLTYMTMAFIRDPIFKYEATSGKNYAGGVLLESVIAQQCTKAKVALKLHTLFKDIFAYGRGYAVPSWEVKEGKRSVVADAVSRMGGTDGSVSRRERIDTVLYEGNTLHSVNPYLALPDPNVPASAVQDGEFFGWLETTNLMSLLSDEYEGVDLFNVQYLRHVSETSSQFMDDKAVTANSSQSNNRNNSSGITRPIDIIAKYVNLIPSEWGLGNGDYPEKWLFRVASDSVLIQASRLDFDHGMFPVVAGAPDDDGRNPTPVSRFETLYGLQEVGDWLFNSHIANVRKSINNMLIVDPAMLNMNDLRDPEPGMLVRLRRPAWGRGVGDVVKQLKVDDITRGNLNDTALIQQAMQTSAGTDASMMGTLRQGGPDRLTKGEFQGTRGSANARLERVAMMLGLQTMQDLGYFFASHTQQYMSEDTYVKITGGLEEDLARELGVEQGRVRVSYDQLLIDYDVMVRDGSIPGGNFSESWVQMFNILSTSPEVAQNFDMVRIFMHIARNLGAKNVDDFKKVQGPTVAPDAAVLDAAAAGNAVKFER